jgi:glycosyltransferase involved in cell wall biosynthesis
MLSLFDVMAIASLAEGHPFSMLEAMAMGKPIVATNVGGIGEILINNDTGVLVPPQNTKAMSSKIIHLFQHDQERNRLGSQAKLESQKYSLATYINELERLYERIINNHN